MRSRKAGLYLSALAGLLFLAAQGQAQCRSVQQGTMQSMGTGQQMRGRQAAAGLTSFQRQPLTGVSTMQRQSLGYRSLYPQQQQAALLTLQRQQQNPLLLQAAYQQQQAALLQAAYLQQLYQPTLYGR